MQVVSGIYEIENIINGKKYIGSSKNINERWMHHRKNLKHNKHENSYLQRAYNKYGVQSFQFKIIEKVALNKLLEREQFWLDKYQTYKRKNGYNILEKSTGGPKRKHFNCTVSDCHNPHLAKGLCNTHYRRLRKTGKLTIDNLPPIKNRGCKVSKCNNKHDSLGYCNKHAYYIRKYGKIQKPKLTFNPDRGCKIQGCKNKHQSKNMCHKHYERERYRLKNLTSKDNKL